MTKSAKIRKLMAKGLSVAEIAKRVKVHANYVHTIKWLDKKKKPKAQFKSPRSRLLQDIFQMKKAVDAVESKPTKLLVQPQYKDMAMKILADNDLVNKPPHYTKGGIDFLDYAEAKGLTENAYLFNVVKYVSRAGKKVGADPVQDLEKAEFYLKREIARRKSA